MTYCLIDFPLLTQGKVEDLTGTTSLCQRFYEMGIRKNAPIRVIGRLPFSQNIHVVVGGESIVLRKEEAFCLEVSRV